MSDHWQRRAAGTVLGALAAGAALFALAAPAAAADGDWFAYDAAVAADWTVTVADADRVEIRPLAGGSDAQQVLVLYSKPSAAYAIAISKILAVMHDGGINAEVTVVNYGDDDARGRQALALADQLGSDLIFAMGSNAAAWLWDSYRDGAIPVVTVCAKDPVVLGQVDSYDRGTGTNFAFTSLNMPVEVQMAYVLDLMPNLQNFGILVDAQNVSAVETQAKPIADFAQALGIEVQYLAVEDPANARTELAGLVAGAVAIMQQTDPELTASAFWITGSTSVFREIQTINRHSDRAPVLSVAPEVVREGSDSAVVSIGISFESNAHLAAIYGVDVLQGRARAGDLPVSIVTPPDIAINFLRARRVGFGCRSPSSRAPAPSTTMTACWCAATASASRPANSAAGIRRGDPARAARSAVPSLSASAPRLRRAP
ncbi:MAG: ABC transporter substrate binding protein [Alphaproteobacteria bacterium]